MLFEKVNDRFISRYYLNDYLHAVILANRACIDKDIIKSKQFRNMIKHRWKRAMFHVLYTDLKGKKVLDVGGAYCGYRSLIDDNDYTLVECDKVFKKIPGNAEIIHLQNFVPKEYDNIVCCDLWLTNGKSVDSFLEKYLPYCKELRMSLTFHFNLGERYSGWTLDELNKLFHKYCIEEKRNMRFTPMTYKKGDWLPGKRNVYLIAMKGDLCKN